MNAIIAQAPVRIRWPAQAVVPVGGYYNIYRRQSGGAFDYDAAPVNAQSIAAWPNGNHPGRGYGPRGMRPRGRVAFGAPRGLGPRGLGQRGVGIFYQEFVTDWTDDGDYDFCVIGYDPAGNRITPAVAIAAVTVAGTPLPPSGLAASDYDAAADVIEFTWTLSEDDRTV